jgi:MerR family redox-sensitive transcriptional activator SoxR
MSARLRDLAERRLPEIDALIERAQRVRTWLQIATGCDCQRIDDCALFDDAPLASAQEARPLVVMHVGGRPA